MPTLVSGIRTSAAAIALAAALACGSAYAAGAPGKVEIGRGEPIQIRALLSGSVVADISPVIEAAVELAIEDFGPIHGHPVSVRTLDEKCSGEGGRAAAEAVVGDANVVGVIGTLCSGAAVEASPILGAAGFSMISPANTSPRLTSDLAGKAGPDYHEGYFRVANNDLVMAGVVARFGYEELGLRRMVAVHDGDAYTSALANAFAVAFRRHGGVVPIVSQVAKGQTDMSAVLAELAGAKPDGVLLPLFPAEGKSLIRQAAGFDGLKGVRMIGGDAMLTRAILALPEAEGLYLTAPDPGDAKNVNQATGRGAADVLRAIETALGRRPASGYWAHGYDAMTLLLSAIKQVAAPGEETLSIDRRALRDALAGTAGFRGLLGTLACDEFGDCGTGRSVIHFHADSSVEDPLRLPVVYKGTPGLHGPRR
ncbi:MAG: branched-chain amino acid ABC transporter substrate-binding protein [Rhodospirillales bacterium]|nr:branched-chain amino acid ABC transporter substrate-binding protein [Rhodospirillales bacterium]